MTDTIRDLLISLASHMAYMQGQLEARHELDSPEDYYWYRESVLLRQKVTDALLADEPAVPAPPADGELAELVAWLHEEADDYVCIGCEDSAAKCRRAAELLQRQVLVPVSVSERLPGPEDCNAEGKCWLCGKVEGDWRLINPEKPGVPHLKYCFTHWLPAHALPLPEVSE